MEIIKSYLSERSVILEHDCEHVERAMTKGAPQGSVLGPIMWNITFDDLLNRHLPQQVTPITFPDDVAYVIEGNSRRELEDKGGRLGETLAEWAHEAKMVIAADKIKGLILKGKLPGRPPWIRFNGQAISFVQKAMYLGVLLDSNLTFMPDVKMVTDKAKAMFGKITRLIRIKYGVKPSKLLFLYETVYVPIIGYAFRVWEQRLRHSHVLPKVRESQRQVLINITGVYRTTSLQALCALTTSLPVYLKLQMGLDTWRAKRGLIEEHRTDIFERYRQLWQEEWSHAETGRYK